MGLHPPITIGVTLPAHNFVKPKNSELKNSEGSTTPQPHTSKATTPLEITGETRASPHASTN
eukprot:8142982-Pyramimonas_sp.AAC.1